MVHTSLLRRAIITAKLALDAADRHWIPVKRSWRLNERHYGALQGKDKKPTMEEFGEEQFMLWRRSYDTPPPPLADDDEWSQVGDPRYADLGDEHARAPSASRTSSSACCPTGTRDRARPAGRQTVLVAAHGNSLRALVKHLDQISDEDVAGLNIPTGIPLVYRLDEDLRPTVRAASTSTPRPRRTRPQRSPTRDVTFVPDRAGVAIILVVVALGSGCSSQSTEGTGPFTDISAMPEPAAKVYYEDSPRPELVAEARAKIPAQPQTPPRTSVKGALPTTDRLAGLRLPDGSAVGDRLVGER